MRLCDEMTSNLQKVKNGDALNPRQFAAIARSHSKAARCVVDGHYRGKNFVQFDSGLTIYSLATLLGIGFETSFKGLCELANDHGYRKNHDLRELHMRFVKIDCKYFDGLKVWQQLEDEQNWRREPHRLFEETRDQSDFIRREDTVELNLSALNVSYGGVLMIGNRKIYSNRYPPPGGTVMVKSYHPPMLLSALESLVSVLEKSVRRWLSD